MCSNAIPCNIRVLQLSVSRNYDVKYVADPAYKFHYVISVCIDGLLFLHYCVSSIDKPKLETALSVLARPGSSPVCLKGEWLRVTTIQSDPY